MTAPPEPEIEQQVRESGLLVAGRPVVVLLSGGRDSTCLLDVAVAIAGRESVTALHLNYGLREEADADEGHCVELCSRLRVPLEVRLDLDVHCMCQHPPRPFERQLVEHRAHVSLRFVPLLDYP